VDVTKPDRQKSIELYRRAESIIMDGTQLYSKMPSVGVEGVSPVFFVKGKGAHVWDLEGNEYIDFTMGLGPCMLGYNHPAVMSAVRKQLESGPIFSLPHPIEVDCAAALVEAIPSAEMVRFLKTGAEATQAAVRIARAYTGREKIIRGHYHGWHEWCIAGTKKDGGIPKVYREYCFEAHYNDLAEYERLFLENSGEIAAVITEPVEFEAPRDDFLSKLKELCHSNGALLLFDEVVTGFRFALGGAQEYFGVLPDVSAFGKGIASGYPLSAVVGSREILDGVKDKIFISSTFGGETLSLAACIATIGVLRDEPVHKRIWEVGARIKEGFNELAQSAGSDICCIGFPPRLGFTFRSNSSASSDELKTLFMQEVAKRGVYFIWNMLPSYATTDQDIRAALKAFDESLRICVAAERHDDVRRRLEGKTPIVVI
jgi:glutamate-1-semialdehyde aminotransferase